MPGPRGRPQGAARDRPRATRTTEGAIRIAQEGKRKEAQRKGRLANPRTLAFARFEIVFTTLPAADFTGAEGPEGYRLRWQVDLVFNCF